MPEMLHFALPQSTETQVKADKTGRFVYRYAYSRSADSRKNNENGQDYLEVRIDGNRLVFALCDGVSQSFFGEFASQRLGQKLIEWLWPLVPLHDKDQLVANLTGMLSDLTEITREEVSKYPIGDDIVPMLRNALEKKRLIGSESTFVAGMLDLQADYGVLFWMGDSRIRLWDGTNEIKGPFEGRFITQERWSSNKGLVGNIHCEIISPTTFDHLVVYSDGFSNMDSAYKKAGIEIPFSNATIARFMDDAGDSATSDDISFLEVWTSKFHPQIPTEIKDAVPSLRSSRDSSNDSIIFHWTDVQADEYEVKLSSKQGTIGTYMVKATNWSNKDASKDPNLETVSVRAWFKGEPGQWSKPLVVNTLPMVPATQVSAGGIESRKMPWTTPPVRLPDIEGVSTPLERKPSRFRKYAVYFAGFLVVSCLVSFAFIDVRSSLREIIMRFSDTPTTIPTVTSRPTAKPTITLTSSPTPIIISTLTEINEQPAPFTIYSTPPGPINNYYLSPYPPK